MKRGKSDAGKIAFRARELKFRTGKSLAGNVKKGLSGVRSGVGDALVREGLHLGAGFKKDCVRFARRGHIAELWIKSANVAQRIRSQGGGRGDAKSVRLGRFRSGVRQSAKLRPE